MGPLQGIKVIELAGIGPAPFCGMMLADMGAEVILVERKSTNPNAAQISTDTKYEIYKRGKESIAIDLKSPDGIELVLKLIDSADVLIEGFRPGVTERLGLGPEVCLERNPGLVYGRMTGWGQDGPLAQAAGHDPNYVAISGAMFHLGAAATPPLPPLTLLGDIGGGAMMLAWGIACALIHSRASGKGQVVDAAITDGVAYMSTLLRCFHSAGDIIDERGQNWIDGAAHWAATYECADGDYITICSLEPQFYRELLERLELDGAPEFSGNSQWDRSRWRQCQAIFRDIFRSKTRDEWCQLLEGTDVCFAPVLNFSEAVRHPHNVARGVFLDCDGVTQPAPAPRLAATPASAGSPANTGEHTESILVSLGLEKQAILSFREQGIVN